MTKFGVFLPVSGRAASRKTLMQAAQASRSARLRFGVGRRSFGDAVENRHDLSLQQRSDVHRAAGPAVLRHADLSGVSGRLHGKNSAGHERHGAALPPSAALGAASPPPSINCPTGRLILGVGVGWMEEEFAAMNAPFKERGKVSDEQLTLLKQLWSEEHISFPRQVLSAPNDIAFLPKPYQKPRAADLGRRRRQIRPAARRPIRRRLVSLFRQSHARRS